MKSILSKLILSSILLSQALSLGAQEFYDDQESFKEKLVLYYEMTKDFIADKKQESQDYLNNKYNQAKEFVNPKIEFCKKKFSEGKLWIENNPKKTAAISAATVALIILILSKKYNLNKNKSHYKPFNIKDDEKSDISFKNNYIEPKDTVALTSTPENEQNVDKTPKPSDSLYSDFMSNQHYTSADETVSSGEDLSKTATLAFDKAYATSFNFNINHNIK